MKRFCYALDLVDDEQLIQEYIEYHNNVWPEIQKSILDSGIQSMEIYCVGNRLFMVTDVDQDFSLDKRASNDGNNKKVQEWEELMWKYQKALPIAKKDEKWVLMNKIYHLQKE
ncbi:L-rhamnose mutarotase [Polaribacter vadi]|uniref:L-rhamnose mutarotase n=1 Tax=Polaribacter TaxID=52959 RepID=UPI001C098B12|nr:MULTISPECIES: L-rhamnose mutarotase [Polaribacter]MBU3010998.1 L-rhamnose mutarotase [Polaribacter vadi]MDO6740811.1 L-rhamnose mutarotase [Polaribacter sp. 1_MG-2023]